MRILLVLSFLYVLSCKSRQLPYPSYLSHSVDTSKVRFDGVYFSDNENTGEIVLTNQKGVAVWGSGSSKETHNCDFYQKINTSFIGQFTIIGNEIFAFAPYTYIKRGKIYFSYLTHFRGEIKNKDTITNWRVVPPYPPELNDKYLKYNFKRMRPRNLYFVKSEAVRCLRKN